MKIHIIAAALPPQIDGIGDYTAHLAAELARSATVTVLTGAQTPDAIPRVGIESIFSVQEPRSVRNLAERIAENKPDWVLLQYNPFSYGRWGLNLHLPEVMHTIKRQKGTRIAVMMHETWTPVFDAKSAVMALWQRRQYERLGQCADVLFFSTECACNAASTHFLSTRRIHLPVGSNIPCVPLGKEQARAHLDIPAETFVLGIFGTPHISRMLNRVHDAAQAVRQAGKTPLVLAVGPSDEGPLSGIEVSRRLAAMDVYLTPFTDGISTRRGTVMCGLQHGLPMVGTMGSSTDSVLKSENGKAFLLAEADCKKQFNAHVLTLLEQLERRKEMGRNAQRLFDENFTWKHIADRLLTTLELAGGAVLCSH